MTTCSKCGVTLAGYRLPGSRCMGCKIANGVNQVVQAIAPAPPSAPVALPSSKLPPGVTVAEHRDAHVIEQFVVSRGDTPAGAHWWMNRVPSTDGFVVMELRATVSGDPSDVAQVLNSSSASLLDERSVEIFKRPLALLVRSEHQLDAETEERLTRLERMMNILVAQDSPAGEALRRLGGAKISFESPTRLAKPALIAKGSACTFRLDLDTAVSLRDVVTVRIGAFGIGKYAVV